MKRRDYLTMGVLAAVAAVLYFASMAFFAFPGESAHLQVLWRSLDVADVCPRPLTAFFARLCGGGNLLAPLSGMAAVVLVYLLTAIPLRTVMDGEDECEFAEAASRIAGVAAAVIFMLMPAVRYAAHHLEPRLFEFAWALAAIAPLLVWWRFEGWKGALVPVVTGVMWGLGVADAALFVQALVLALALVFIVSRRLGRRWYADLALFFFAGVIACLLTLKGSAGGFDAAVDFLIEDYDAVFDRQGWMLAFGFSALPFLGMAIMLLCAHVRKGDFARIVFYLAMGFVTVLAVATPLSASSLMASYGVLPVAASGFAAMTAGLLLAQLWTLAKVSSDAPSLKVVSYSLFGLLTFVFAVASLLETFRFDSRRGEFADRAAEIVLDELDGRDWLVSDGWLRIDDHLRLAAARRGQPLRLVSLDRDADRRYRDELKSWLPELKLPNVRELELSFDLGIVPFVQDWFASDTNAPNRAAVIGASDLWLASEGLRPVPEFMVFGGDERREADWSRWDAFRDAVEADDGWGSYSLRGETDPVETMRLELRRHLAMMATDRGFYLQELGRDAEAAAFYARALDELDADNISALFNAYDLARKSDSSLSPRKAEFERRLRSIVADRRRRYLPTMVANYYGYIANPEILALFGSAWARSGLPGRALSQMRRAMSFSSPSQHGRIMNCMATLYASDGDDEASRSLYGKVLDLDPEDHDALVGMMRLSLSNGDAAMARDYLSRAIEAAGDDPRADCERAMLAMMDGRLKEARGFLNRATDADAEDMDAWALTASLLMRQADESTNAVEKAAIVKELENGILPAMEKATLDINDYHLQTVRGFVNLRKGEAGREAARDAFAAAAHARPEMPGVLDLVMDLDISLNDREHAVQHAREALCRNRNSPLGNYIMGSTAIVSNDYAAAEYYLAKAANGEGALPAAMGDLADIYLRLGRFGEALVFARKACTAKADFYPAYDTVASAIVETKGDLNEAKTAIEKAVELATVDGRLADARLLLTLARVQFLLGDRPLARSTLRKAKPRLDEFPAYDRSRFDELEKLIR